jgi:hypothetical protein
MLGLLVLIELFTEIQKEKRKWWQELIQGRRKDIEI